MVIAGVLLLILSCWAGGTTPPDELADSMAWGFPTGISGNVMVLSGLGGVVILLLGLDSVASARRMFREYRKQKSMRRWIPPKRRQGGT